MKIGIITTPRKKRPKLIKALEEERVDYVFINMLKNDWLSYFQGQFDGYIIYPPAYTEEWKNTFFKRLFYVSHLIHNKVTPNLKSISMYESKIAMHDFYKVHNIPHVNSKTFYNIQDAYEYAHGCKLPVVLKEDSGSGAKGVRIINDRKELIKLVRKSFYYNQKVNNSINFNDLKSKLLPYKMLIDTKSNYLPIEGRRKGFIHVQNYEKVKYEWRIIRIGESYFGHKKVADDLGYHSGSLSKEWGEIPSKVLNLVKNVSTKINFNNMCFDIFETEEGEFYFNELQALFGTSTEEQLIINGSPGRYVYKNNKWLFETGEFTKNGCNNLRIQLIKEIIRKNNDE